MFHICIRSLLTNKKNEKKSHRMFLIFCSTKLKFLRREPNELLHDTLAQVDSELWPVLRLLSSDMRMRSSSFAKHQYTIVPDR